MGRSISFYPGMFERFRRGEAPRWPAGLGNEALPPATSNPLSAERLEKYTVPNLNAPLGIDLWQVPKSNATSIIGQTNPKNWSPPQPFHASAACPHTGVADVKEGDQSG
jgi:hypothetical protein